jgi:hypothetical protein
MTVKKEQAIEWSTRDKIVWGKPRTYSGWKRIYPKFQYGTTPWKEGDYYIERYKDEKFYSVRFYLSGYTSLNQGHIPSQTKTLLSGESLTNCKKYLSDLISKYYDGLKNDV